MKPIKIAADNVADISTALFNANGRAEGHTLTSGSAVVDIAAVFEAQLVKLVGSKKSAVGARAFYQSGDQLPSAYKYSRRVTLLTLERRSTGWYLTQAKAGESYREAGPQHLILTEEQDAIAVSIFKKSYRVQLTSMET